MQKSRGKSIAVIVVLVFILTGYAPGFTAADPFSEEPPENPADAEWPEWKEDYPRFDFSAPKLRENWDALHRRDGLPWPDEEYVKRFYENGPDDDPGAVVRRLREGWRAFHEGDFQRAWRIGNETGPPGGILSAYAWLVYVTRSVEDQNLRRRMLKDQCERLEPVLERGAPRAADWELACLALLYGNYARNISTGRARIEKVPERVKALVEAALEKNPENPLALGVLGIYHAEIVSRLGDFLGRVAYGATGKEAEKHFERAIAADPGFIQLRVEYARALLSLFGENRENEALAHLDKALETKPRDALEFLEQKRAERIRSSWTKHNELP